MSEPHFMGKILTAYMQTNVVTEISLLQNWILKILEIIVSTAAWRLHVEATVVDAAPTQIFVLFVEDRTETKPVKEYLKVFSRWSIHTPVFNSEILC